MQADDSSDRVLTTPESEAAASASPSAPPSTFPAPNARRSYRAVARMAIRARDDQREDLLYALYLLRRVVQEPPALPPLYAWDRQPRWQTRGVA